MWNFFFGNEDQVLESMQRDFGKMQTNFRTLVSSEHKNFDALKGDNQILEEAINQLKLQEIADRHLSMNLKLEIDLLHRLQLMSTKVNHIIDSLADTTAIINEVLLMQQQ